MIKFNNVSKSFEGKQVLESFNLTLLEGDRVCLMGPSGCGKTTVGNLLLGILSPDEGEIFANRDDIAAVFQEDRLCEDFSALSNCRMVRPDMSAPYALSVLSKLLPAEDIRKPVRTFSGGMKRRVAIARALCADRKILLLDEPFSGLDGDTKESVAATIREHSHGKTLLMISHDRREAELLGAEIIEM
ncbi:MAG: ABC transporter ATP-binding protein [Clostridia bacterium]|nr:ABC transporter ATP-binding protein [Clostridia bacterium]